MGPFNLFKRERYLNLVLVLAGLFLIARGHAQSPSLISELGCAHCHGGLPEAGPRRIPSLRSAGLRYQPAYLFDFLQNPTQVRRHLGAARMPNFHLSSAEAAALTAFLCSQKEEPLPALPPEMREALAGPVQAVTTAAFQAAGLELCLTCHTLDGQGGVLGNELNTTGHRLNPDWVRQFMAGPDRFGVPAALMPALPLPPDPTHPALSLPETAARIRILSDYLFQLGSAQRQKLQQRYTAAKANEADPELGQKMFVALNCAGCHPFSDAPPRQVGPDLADVTRTMRLEWLRNFLRQPTALRPAGYHPGDGSRMPNFRLNEREVNQLLTELKALGATTPVQPPTPHLSAFAVAKAQRLLTDKLACLGCHRLGQLGGRIGPDLTDVGRRRSASYIREMVLNPQLHRPETIMPRIPLPGETTELIIRFLAQQTNQTAGATYLSLASLPLSIQSASTQPAPLYASHCAGCHGPSGKGDGFNAAFLPVRPTTHADAAYMSQRPDDTLFDGIYAGGAILNRSHFMPPWGGTFHPDQIAGLVKHLRSLCGCAPPAWSVDPTAGPDSNKARGSAK